MTTSRWLSVTTVTVLVLTGGAVGAAALSHTAAVSDRITPARTAVGRLESGPLA